jgi:hypothetical protein
MRTGGITSVPTTERAISGRSRMQVHFLAENSFLSRVWILQIIIPVLVAASNGVAQSSHLIALRPYCHGQSRRWRRVDY